MQGITSAHRSNSLFVFLSHIVRFTEKILALICLFVSLPMLSSPAIAQTLLASFERCGIERRQHRLNRLKGLIAGTVVDSQGAAVPGAQLKLSPLAITVVSNDQGEFRLPEVPAGKYTLTVYLCWIRASDVGCGDRRGAEPEFDSDA